jgi:ATP-dependent DNA helicase 2 subunit 2
MKRLGASSRLRVEFKLTARLPTPSAQPGSEKYPWYQPQESYNPAIHRLKDAVYHQAITTDLDADPIPPPHPDIVKYLEPPQELKERIDPVVDKLKGVLDIRLIPPPVKKADQKAAAVAGSTEE